MMQPQVRLNTGKEERIPVPDELYDYAASGINLREVQHRLLCSRPVAQALRGGDRSLRLTPMQIQIMLLQKKHLQRMTRSEGVTINYRNINKRQLKYARFLKAVIRFTAENWEDLLILTPLYHGKHHFVIHPLYKSVFKFSDTLYKGVVPHLVEIWNEYPELRPDLFGGTDFEAKVINSNKERRKTTITLRGLSK